MLDPGWTEQMQINTIEPSPSASPATTGSSLSSSATSRPVRSSSSGCSFRSTRRTSAAARRTLRSTTTRRSSHTRPQRDHLPLMDIVIRAFVLFVFVLLLTRLIGRRELSLAPAVRPDPPDRDRRPHAAGGDPERPLHHGPRAHDRAIFGLLTLAVVVRRLQLPVVRPILEPRAGRSWWRTAT